MIIGLFVASAVALAVFVWVESRAAEPILPIRLFTSPVFTVCCILGFIVGFAMLGALTFLPTFMQFVDGVSATTSGMRTLPMVAGMLITSIGSGNIVGRTGRYKVFPVVGTATMAVGFRCSPGWTPPRRPGSSPCTCSCSARGSGCACRCSCSSCRTPRPSKISVWRRRVSRSSAPSEALSVQRFSARCSPTSSRAASDPRWQPVVRRRVRPSRRRRCTRCRRRRQRR